MIANLISRAFSPRAQSSERDPHSNFWYGPVGTTSSDALTVSTVFACIRVRSNTVGSLPWHVYRDSESGVKAKAPEHPWYATLHDKPNVKDTPKQFKSFAMTCVDLRGNFFAEVLPPGGFTESPQLRPMHPDNVTVEEIESGRKQFIYRPPNGEVRTLTQDQVYHRMGPSFDGLTGVSPFTYARELTTLTAAQQVHARKTFDRGGFFKYALETDKSMGKQDRITFRDQWAGLQQEGEVPILDQGLKIHTLGMSMVDAQWLESQQWTGKQFCQFLSTPPHLVFLDDSTKANSEQKARDWLAFHFNPELIEFEQSIQPWLGSGYFSQFKREALVQADIKTRYEAHAIALAGRAWKSVNEIRTIEDMPPKEGEDELPPPPNQSVPAENASKKFNTEAEPPEDDDSEATGPDLKPLIADAAARIVAAEVRGIDRLAAKANGSRVQLDKWLVEFYGKHGEYIERTLAPLEAATGVELDCDQLCVDSLNELGGRDVPHLAATWKTDKPARLAGQLEGILCPNTTTT